LDASVEGRKLKELGRNFGGWTNSTKTCPKMSFVPVRK